MCKCFMWTCLNCEFKKQSLEAHKFYGCEWNGLTSFSVYDPNLIMLSRINPFQFLQTILKIGKRNVKLICKWTISFWIVITRHNQLHIEFLRTMNLKKVVDLDILKPSRLDVERYDIFAGFCYIIFFKYEKNAHERRFNTVRSHPRAHVQNDLFPCCVFGTR